MERYPLMYQGVPVGEMTTETSGLYVRFQAAGRLPDQGLWCAWAVGEKGQLRLGVLEPGDGGASICRRISAREASGLGTMERGELRPADQRTPQVWENAAAPEQLFSTGWLRRGLRGRMGVLTRSEGLFRYVAIPWEPGEPFPLISLFCLASVQTVEGRRRAVFRFGEGERPVLP